MLIASGVLFVLSIGISQIVKRREAAKAAAVPEEIVEPVVLEEERPRAAA